MRALVQRVTEASVTVDGEIVGSIKAGLCVFLGVGRQDTEEDARKLAAKVINLRIFSDEEGKMNRNLLDLQAELLVVPQFTLYGDTNHGNRPSYSEAASSEIAKGLFKIFLTQCRENCSHVASGVFQAHMQVRLLNDGPVTLLCHSRKSAE